MSLLCSYWFWVIAGWKQGNSYTTLPVSCGRIVDNTVKFPILDALNHKTWMFLLSSHSCLCTIYWSKVLSQEWRCNWSSADRRSSKYIWVINNFIVRRAGLLWSQQDFEWRWSVPLFKCLTVLEFSFILFDLCLLITFFNFIMNYVPIVTFWIFTYHKIWILSIMFCFIWSYWIIYFLACLEVSWRVVS